MGRETRNGTRNLSSHMRAKGEFEDSCEEIVLEVVAVDGERRGLGVRVCGLKGLRQREKGSCIHVQREREWRS